MAAIKLDVNRILQSSAKRTRYAGIVAGETLLNLVRPYIPTDTERLRRSGKVKRGVGLFDVILEFRTDYALTQYYGRKGKPLRHIVRSGMPARIIDQGDTVPKNRKAKRSRTRAAKYRRIYRRLTDQGVLQVLPNKGQWFDAIMADKNKMRIVKEAFQNALKAGTIGS